MQRKPQPKQPAPQQPAVCGNCKQLMTAYKFDKAQAEKQCHFCKCRLMRDVKKTEAAVRDILVAFASGLIFPFPVNPREVYALVCLPDKKSVLGKCVRLTGLTPQDVDPELVSDVVKETLVSAISARSRNNMPRLDSQAWLGVDKIKEPFRMSIFDEHAPPEAEGEVRKSFSKDIRLENKTAIEVEATEGAGGGKRYSIYGHNVTSVLRWMGLDGWEVKQAKLACAKLGLPIADATVQAQIRAGKDGTRGDPAKLTGVQQDALNALLEDRPCQKPKQTSASNSRTAPTAEKSTPTSSKRSGSANASSSRPVTAAPAQKTSTSKSSKSNIKVRVREKPPTKTGKKARVKTHRR